MSNSSSPKSWRDALPIHSAAELFPLMSEPELRELGEDIKKRGGLIDPITFVQVGDHFELLDGRNRPDAMDLVDMCIDFKRWGKEGGDIIRLLPDGMDPYDFVLTANLHRRHLTSEQKRELIDKVLKAKPEASNATVAKQTKTTDKTVAKRRRKLESTSEIPKLKKTVGADGKSRPKIKKSAPKSQRGSVSAKDIALKDFTARALELIRLTKNNNPDRFANTSLSFKDLRQLGHFFLNLALVCEKSARLRLTQSAGLRSPHYWVRRRHDRPRKITE